MMRFSRFRLVTLLGMFVLLGIGFVFWQQVIEPRYFSPTLEMGVLYGEGTLEQPYTAMVIEGEGRTQIVVLDFFLDKAGNSQSGRAEYTSHSIGGGKFRLAVEIEGNRVFARDGGLRLLIRRRNGTWEDRFIPDDKKDEMIDVEGYKKRPAEFWLQFKES